jgi:hypothetical protein
VCRLFFRWAQTRSGGQCPPCPYPLVAAQHWQRVASATPAAVRLLLVPFGVGVGIGIGIDSDCVLWLVLTLSKSHLLSFDSDSDTDPDTDYDPYRDRGGPTVIGTRLSCVENMPKHQGLSSPTI